MSDITVSRDAAVLTIAINRPERLNSVTTDVLNDLADLILEAGADPDVRVITLTGTGRAFSSGADLKSGAGGKPGTDTIMAANRLIRAVRDARQPTVAVVNGPAVGVGCSLALAADLVLASSNAYFLLSFTSIGLMPDGGATALVPTAVGRARAMAMALVPERIPASEAVAWGLIYQAVDAEELDAAAKALTDRLATGGATGPRGGQEGGERGHADVAGGRARARARRPGPPAPDQRRGRSRRRVRGEAPAEVHRGLRPGPPAGGPGSPHGRGTLTAVYGVVGVGVVVKRAFGV